MLLSLFPRQAVFLFLLLLADMFAYAHNGKGGTIMYQYLGAGSNTGTSKYQVTVQHCINCERIADEPNQIYLGIFDAGTDALVTKVTITQTGKTEITQDCCRAVKS